MAKRSPIAPLRPFIKLLWATEERRTDAVLHPERERLLPSGNMHLVFRLSDHPIRIFNSVDETVGKTFHRGVIGGMRAGFYVKDISQPVRSVGALLQPGASEVLFGAYADELSERHTLVDDIWGNPSHFLWEQLSEEKNPHHQLDIFESFLLKRLPRVHGVHPAIAHALGRLSSTNDIGEIVDETGYSHRRFLQLFKRTVGLAPRLYTRVLRFQTVLKILKESPMPWSDLALCAGYSDQAHFNREFREFTGVSPSEYLVSIDGDSHHVPIKGSISFNTKSVTKGKVRT